MRLAVIIAALFSLCGVMLAQETVWVCPMDPDVRSNQAGVCPRCGMKLRSGIPERVEYHLDLTEMPRLLKPNQPATLEFSVRDPWKNRPVTRFQVVHEKLFHMFVVSQDLKFFLHDHPIFEPDGTFRYRIQFPKPGMYRVLGDFYPDGATPQLIAKTVIVPGSGAAAPGTPTPLTRDYSAKDAENMHIEFWTVPPQPVAGMNTQLHFKVTANGFEKYLGAWGHMLVASDDLIDLIHTHPFIADGGPNVQFNVTFPRAHGYRVWVQFQRKGVVNTAHFDVPVTELK
ncbi:MAG TPA: heavy metal-binding domain-containing protein [Bryobacteraceae bacterium]|nr:heavy metal-binding domain-containing protein [Bryobacteraceae bacterium]